MVEISKGLAMVGASKPVFIWPNMDFDAQTGERLEQDQLEQVRKMSFRETLSFLEGIFYEGMTYLFHANEFPALGWFNQGEATAVKINLHPNDAHLSSRTGLVFLSHQPLSILVRTCSPVADFDLEYGRNIIQLDKKCHQFKVNEGTAAEFQVRRVGFTQIYFSNLRTDFMVQGMTITGKVLTDLRPPVRGNRNSESTLVSLDEIGITAPLPVMKF